VGLGGSRGCDMGHRRHWSKVSPLWGYFRPVLKFNIVAAN